MATFNKFRAFVQDLGRKVHNLNSDSLKVLLTNTVPVNTNAVLADLTDLSTASGYTAGGTASAGTAYSQTAGVGTLSGGNVVFTASGGAIGPFRYAAIYNATASGGPLIGWWDYGSSISLNSGDSLTVDLSANVLTVT